MFVLFELGTPGWVSIASHDGACLLDTIAVATTDLPIAEVFLTRTAADSGSLIVMIGRWASDGGEADALIRWSADTVIPSEHQFNRVWGIDLYSGHALDETTREQIVGPLVVRPGRGSGFWPLRVRQGGQMTYYVWREAAFLLPATLVPEP